MVKAPSCRPTWHVRKRGSARTYLVQTLATIYAHTDDVAPIDVTDRARVRLACTNAIQGAVEKGDETIEVTFPMLDVLRRTLEVGQIGTETYIATRQGKPMTKESIGNLFKEKCVAAGLVNRSAHGLRKAAATVAAENGATEAELDAIFGWTDRRMASHYTKKVNHKKLAYGGAAKLERMTGSMDH
jgi:integrase